jgi:predicted dinucleotide-binding enzyme
MLIESAGFDAVDSGPLSNARYLKPLGMRVEARRFEIGDRR